MPGAIHRNSRISLLWSRVFYSRLSVFLLIAAEFGCQKKAAGPPPRYAVLRFENLTGDPAFDWTGRAASEMLSYSLSGAMDGAVLNSAALGRLAGTLGTRPAAVPGISSERTQAIVAGATRLISGYISRAGVEVRIVAQEEDLATGKSLRTVSATSASPLPAINLLARQFSDRAKPYLTSREDAARLYFSGVEAPFDITQRNLAEAVKLDPGFGPAWLSWAGLALVRGDRAEAANRIAEAHTHKLDALTEASLDSESASLQNDPVARLAALQRISNLSPGDIVLLRSLAENETTSGQFAAAMISWKKVIEALPGDLVAWNSLGYLHAYTGDYAAAMAALNEYKRLRPADANPIDSTGDVQYWFGKFREAAASYEAANAKDPNALRFGELYKAAWAKFKAGDKAAADASFEKFRAAREKLPDPLTPLLTADWFYRTGRAKEGIAILRKTLKETASPQLKSDAAAQLAIWDLLAGNRAAAGQDSALAGAPTTASAALVRFVMLPPASSPEWQTRAARMLPGPAAEAVRRLALGYALLLDGKRTEAIPVWQQIAQKSAATDFFTRAIATRLQGNPLQHPLIPDPNNLNQFAAVLDTL